MLFRSHSIDLARFLVGEIESASGTVRTFVHGRAVDDAFVATVEFENGATGTLEASHWRAAASITTRSS